MLGVVLPRVTGAIAGIYVGISINISIEAVVVIDGDVVVSAVPSTVVAPSPRPHRSHGYSDAERECHAPGHSPSARWRRWVVNGRIWIGRRTINDHRIVGRHLDHLRVRLLNNDH